MNCAQIQRRLSAYLDHELPERETLLVAQHVERCTRCRQEWEAYQAIRAKTRALAALSPIGDPARSAIRRWQVERAAAAPATTLLGRPHPRSRFWLSPQAVGVVGLAAAAGVLSLLIAQRPPRARPQQPHREPVAQAPLPRPLPARPHHAGNTPRVRPSSPPDTDRAPTRMLSQKSTGDSTAYQRQPQRQPQRHFASSPPGFEQQGSPVPRRTPRPGDDLKYLNGDSAAFARRWAQIPPDAMDALEAQLRQMRRGDDFVHVPLPQFAGMAGVGATEAASEAIAAYQREAGIVDPRLARKVSVLAKGISFSDLCQRLKEDTGIDFAAGRSVADDKATLFCTERPLRDIMRQISTLFNFTWERSGEEGSYQYRLTQTLRAQLLEEELRNRDRNEALLALDREMDKYRQYLDLTPEQAHQRAEGASGEEKRRLEALAGAGWGPVRLYFGLSPEERSVMGSGQKLAFSTAPGNGEREMAPEMARGVLQAADSNTRISLEPGGGGANIEIGPNASKGPGMPPSTIPGASALAQLQLDRSDLGRTRLLGFSGVSVGAPGRDTRAMMGRDLGTGVSPSVLSPDNAKANAGLAQDPHLKKRISVTPDPERPGTEKGDSSTEPARTRTTADALEAIHKATGRDVIGDFYTRLYAPEVMAIRETPLFDALNRLGDALGMRWNKESDWLAFRSTGFFNDRLKEVPNRLLARWSEARRQSGALTPESFIEIAQLTDAQLDAGSMAEGARTLHGLKEWDVARGRNLREHWRFLGSLPPALRRMASGPKGLLFRQLPLAQQQKYIALTFGPDAGPSEAGWEDLAEASLRLEYQPPVEDAGSQKTPGTKTAPKVESVRFTYQYGGPNTGRNKMVITPTSMSKGREDPGQQRQEEQRQETREGGK